MSFRFFLDLWARCVGHIRDGFISFGCVAVTIAFGCFLRSGDRSKCESRKKGRLILVPALVCLSVGSMLVWLPENKHRKEAESKWLEERRFTNFGIFDGMADRLAILYPQLRRNFRYLYDYGYALHKECRYEESNVILREGALISSDPMFYNIIGKNHEALGDYELAERNYIHAHNMVPSRLYPYILLMEMKERQGNTEQALAYARKALSLPVNERNMSMRDLHERARKYYDEHKKD